MKYFTIAEMTASNVARSKGIENVPLVEHKVALTALINNVLDPLREAYGKPIIVTSGYRSQILNKMVGGVPTSQHTKGEAADIVPKNRKDMKRLWELAQELPDYDQLINESPDPHGVPSWIHISYKREGNRKEMFTL